MMNEASTQRHERIEYLLTFMGNVPEREIFSILLEESVVQSQRLSILEAQMASRDPGTDEQ